MLNDLAYGSANNDHVVLRPAGVSALNSKWSNYRLEESEARRLMGRLEYDEVLTVVVMWRQATKRTVRSCPAHREQPPR